MSYHFYNQAFGGRGLGTRNNGTHNEHGYALPSADIVPTWPGWWWQCHKCEPRTRLLLLLLDV